MALSRFVKFCKLNPKSLTELAIAKSDLTQVGLVASATNTAESLLVAILLLVLRSYQGQITAQGQPLTDNRERALTYKLESLYERIVLARWQSAFKLPDRRVDTFICHLYCPDETEFGSSINPNWY